MKRCKRDGESRNNQGAVSEDRISELPEALIVKILSLLPTKLAISTSVLSKEWKSLWTMMPNLKFDSCDQRCEFGTFSENAFRSLLSHKAPIIECLHLNFSLDSISDAVDVGMWIGIAYARHVRKLVLHLTSMNNWVEIPESFYNCEILETLTLRDLVYGPYGRPFQVCLKSLKTLHLHSLWFENDASVPSLLSGCPNLENLSIHHYLGCEVKTLTIAVPSLQRLSICNASYAGYVINAPSLKYLKIRNCYGNGFSLIFENVTKILEASIINVAHITDDNLMASLTSVKRLSLKSSLAKLLFKFPTGSIFDQLVNLELYTTKKAWWDLLDFMLHHSPKLKVLKFIDSPNPRSWRKDFKHDGKWKKSKTVPTCLLFHLETFTLEGYNRLKFKVERKVVRYILRKAKHLKRATFSSKLKRYGFENVSRASNSSQLVFI